MTAHAPGFLAHPTHNLFFTGKGGVGKTSMACAAALALAGRGKVLLVSTDPASNVGQVFGIKIGNQVKFACVDGPDFDGHQVDFDDLMTRLRRFTTQEKTAVERWSENCRMTNPLKTLAVRVARPEEETFPDPFDEVAGG